MKVLMLADLYSPVTGGAERHIQSLSRELARRGHEIRVCTIGHPSLPRYEEEDGVKLYRLEGLFSKLPFLFKDQMKRRHPPTADWLVTKKLESILVDEKPDIVHAHGRILYSMLPLRKKIDTPLVLTLHGYWAICPTASLMSGDIICDSALTGSCVLCARQSYGLAKSLFVYLGTRINRTELKLVDKFIAVSSFVREIHARYLGLDGKDIVVIPNFYAADAIARTGNHGNLPQDFILFVGELIPTKGVNVLIEAYRKLDTRTKLVLIGSKHPGFHYDSTENIMVIENAPYDLVKEAYQNCRFAIFPSAWHEPCATVTFEAMSYRKAVITSNMGGFSDIVVDGETGILVPPNDSEALAGAIESLLQTPEVAEEMGRRGYERWKLNYSPEVVVPQIEQLYNSLTS